MANFFPCPNPACTYQFDASQLPEAAMVTCPICRTRFPYRDSANKAPTRPPARRQQAEANPFDEDNDATSLEAEDTAPPPRSREKSSSRPKGGKSEERPNRLRNQNYPSKGGRGSTALMLVGISVVLLGILATIFFSMRGNRWFGDDEVGKDYVDQNFNFRFLRFETRWIEDQDLRKKLGMNAFIMRSKEPQSWIGVRAKTFDSGARNPSPNELNIELEQILKNNFTSVQKTAQVAKIAKIDVNGFEFEAEYDGTLMKGQIHAFANKGIGYWMIIFSPRDVWDDAKGHLTSLRDSFEFATLRDTWKEQVPPAVPHFVPDGDYQLEDGDRIWHRAIDPNDDAAKGPVKFVTFVLDPKSNDDHATMLFRCPHPLQLKKAMPDIVADAVVLVLDKGEGVDDVRAYLNEKKEKEDTFNAKYTFEKIERPPSGTPFPKTDGSMASYVVTNSIDQKQKQYYAIATMKQGSKLIAAIGWCKEPLSDSMEPYILRLIGSLKPR